MLHPPVEQNLHDTIIFRNDDVSVDTNVENFKCFCGLFHKYGFVQLHGVTLYGKLNNTLVCDGIPWIYDEISPEEMHIYEKCVGVSKDFIGDNKELIEYLNSIPDPIALHGLYHSDYSLMTFEQQEHDIVEGLRLLHLLFPNKLVNTFIAPFNHVNEDTYTICEKYGLMVSALEGEHLEDRLDNGKGPLYEGELYRYHHNRFYEESTYYYYDLSIEKLEDYLKKFSYTVNPRTKRVMPSESLLKACNVYCNVDCVWQENENAINSIEQSILKFVESDKRILLVNMRNSSLIHRLWSDGYTDIIEIDRHEKYLEVARLTSKMIGSNLTFYNTTIKDFPEEEKVDAILFYDDKQDGSINDLFDYGARLLNEQGLFVVVSSSFEETKLFAQASSVNARLINCKPYSQKQDDSVYVFFRKKPKICFYCDVPNWAYDNNAKALKRYLSDEFEIDIRYVVNHESFHVNDYDAFLVFFWGEKSYQKERYSKSRVIKQVASHRWQYDKQYGPISVEDLCKAYLNDADTIICPSRILYDILMPSVKNVFLCSDGYDAKLFAFEKKRQGQMSLCMVGNFLDPVKGVEDLLIPAAKGYKLELVKDIKHDKLKDFYNKHDIYVVSSKHEANPLPLIESMACGCFPVASRIGIAPELIRHKENGYLVENRTVEEFKKAFEWCENNLKYIRERAPLIAEEMKKTREWEKMAENYRKMLKNHISRK